MVNCIIIDDEQHAIDVLAHHIRQSGQVNLLGGFTDPLQALQFLGAAAVDLIFLDIHMPQLSGMDFIRTIDKKYKVVLCTAYPGYAAEGFELDVADYLVKPVSLPRFLKCIQKVNEQLHTVARTTAEENQDDFMVVKTGTKGGLIKIQLQDIRLIEGMKNYVTIYYGNEKVMSLISMKELEERLPATRFMRVHKSFIISLAEVKAVEGNSIQLRHLPQTVQIGDTYRNTFLSLMKDKLVGR